MRSDDRPSLDIEHDGGSFYLTERRPGFPPRCLQEYNPCAPGSNGRMVIGRQDCTSLLGEYTPVGDAATEEEAVTTAYQLAIAAGKTLAAQQHIEFRPEEGFKRSV